MTIFQAILMGIVQGITEFLPVSSSGHLLIGQSLLGIKLEDVIIFDILLHLGTLGAIFLAYFKDIKELFVEGIRIVVDFFVYCSTLVGNIFLKQKRELKKIIHSEYRKFVMLVIVASIPTAIIGLLLEDTIKENTSILLPGICLLVTGALLLLSRTIQVGKKDVMDMGFKSAIGIGVVQGIAVLPGISRSGSTLVAGLLFGLNKEFAIKFSFIMSIPAVLGAALLQAKDVTREMLTKTVLVPYIFGMLTAAFVGYFCIITLLQIIKKDKLHYFSYYCFTLGLLAIVGHFVI